VILPATLTLFGDIQTIYFFNNRPNAKVTPMDKHVGKAGGTVIVIRSNEFITIWLIGRFPLLYSSY